MHNLDTSFQLYAWMPSSLNYFRYGQAGSAAGLRACIRNKLIGVEPYFGRVVAFEAPVPQWMIAARKAEQRPLARLADCPLCRSPKAVS